MYNQVLGPEQNVAGIRSCQNQYTTERFGPTDNMMAFLNSATTDYLEDQSGNSQPYFYLEAIISGKTAVFGKSYTSTNWLMDGGTLDRERPAFPGDKSKLISADVTVKVDNSTRYFSPEVTGSVFFGNLLRTHMYLVASALSINLPLASMYMSLNLKSGV